MSIHAFKTSSIALPLCLAAALPAQADANSPVEALSSGKAALELRYRFELVDQPDLFDDKANAHTLRVRLGYESARWNGLRLRAEADHVAALLDDEFNSTRNGETGYPTVADPKGTDLNQLAVDYQATDALSFTLGRQRLSYDNQRFIGSVAWRQNEQTFDALSMQWKATPDIVVSYAYLEEIRRVFGPDEGTPPEKWDSDSHLLNASGTFGIFTVTGYHYALDLEDAPALSSQTTGLRVAAKPTAGGFTFPITLEYAKQSDYADNATDFDADYTLIEAGVERKGYGLSLGREVLGADGDAGVALQTPLATLHLFQGVTDLFLTTPANGMEDSYVRLRAPLGPLALTLGYNRFEADRGNADYGDETSAVLAWKVNPTLQLMLKAADYQAEDFGTDTTKMWLMATLSF